MTFLPMSVPSHFKCQRKAVEITAPLGCIRERGGKMLPKGLGRRIPSWDPPASILIDSAANACAGSPVMHEITGY